MTRPWSLRRRLVFGSLAWTGVLMTLLWNISLLADHTQIRITAFTHLGLVVFIGILGVSAGVMQLRFGLSPFERLRAQLLAVRDGREPKVTDISQLQAHPFLEDLIFLQTK